MVPSAFANILHSPVDFSPSEGQSLHLLSITVPAVAFRWSSAHLQFYISKVASSNRAEGDLGKAPQPGTEFKELSKGPGLLPCLRQPHVLLLLVSTLYS